EIYKHPGEIANSKRPEGKPKPRRDLEADVHEATVKAIKSSQEKLAATKPRSFIPNYAEAAKPWEARARTSRTDLAGYWNDVRHEVGVRIRADGFPQADAALISKALDLLEAADGDGGFTPWLERWRGEVSYTKPSYEECADAAAAIEKSVKFTMELL